MRGCGGKGGVWWGPETAISLSVHVCVEVADVWLTGVVHEAASDPAMLPTFSEEVWEEEEPRDMGKGEDTPV